MATQFETIDDYIGSFPPDVQAILEAIRQTVLKAAPAAEETISYQMPTFKLNGKYLVYVGAWKHHIGIYPIPSAGETLEREISQYRAAKDTLRFPLGEPVPYELIERVVTWLRQRRERNDREP